MPALVLPAAAFTEHHLNLVAGDLKKLVQALAQRPRLELEPLVVVLAEFLADVVLT